MKLKTLAFGMLALTSQQVNAINLDDFGEASQIIFKRIKEVYLQKGAWHDYDSYFDETTLKNIGENELKLKETSLLGFIKKPTYYQPYLKRLIQAQACKNLEENKYLIERCSMSERDALRSLKEELEEKYASIEGYNFKMQQLFSQWPKEYQEKEAHRINDLKIGKTKPKTFSELRDLNSASWGGELVFKPLLRPNGNKYGIIGKIDSTNNNILIGVLETQGGCAFGRCVTGEIRYYKVNISSKTKISSGFNENASIGSHFGMIGTYLENQNYETVSGQGKTMPVFEATQLVFIEENDLLK